MRAGHRRSIKRIVVVAMTALFRVEVGVLENTVGGVTAVDHVAARRGQRDLLAIRRILGDLAGRPNR